jgi:SpoVK/Ycf46/Vps4 family AAA+-type ATPase
MVENLWIDKYYPKCGKDLIGNVESICEIRKWLKDIKSKLDTLLKINNLKNTLKIKHNCKVLAKNITQINEICNDTTYKNWDQLTKDEKYNILIEFTELEQFGLETKSNNSIDSKKKVTKKAAASNQIDRSLIVRAKNIELYADILYEYLELLYVFTKIDSQFKPAIILSGNPGCGKTATANVLSKENGFEVLSFNASNQRSKSAIHENITRIYENLSLYQLSSGKYPLIIMDEVDGMSTGDKGGVTALTKIINPFKGNRSIRRINKENLEKRWLVPIICIANNYNCKKINEL